MKLRNKKTGEIEEFEDITRVFKFIGNQNTYNSLAEFIEEWEDYEESKEYWYIKHDGCITITCGGADDDMKQIGNYFETEEEAEKAVEKLKAVKRLKDKGISFEVKVIDRKWYLEPKAKPQQRTFDEAHDLFNDVMIVFGGE